MLVLGLTVQLPHFMIVLAQADWGDSTVFAAGISGDAGYNFNMVMKSGSGSFSESREMLRVDTCLPQIVIGGVVTIGTNCVLKSTVSGSVTGCAGKLTSSSYLAASASFGGGYTDGVWSTDGASSWAYNPPKLSGGITCSEIALSASITPVAEVTVSMGNSIMSLNFETSISIQPVVGLQLDSASRRRLSVASGPKLLPVTLMSVAIAGELPLGGNFSVDVDLLDNTENAVFAVTSPCWKENLVLTLLTTPLPGGRSTVDVPIPWNMLFLETPCEYYTFTAFSAALPHVISAIDVQSTAPGPCQRAALVSSPSDGDLVSPSGLLAVAWDPAQLFFMRGSDDAPNGKLIQEADHVTIQLVGTTKLPFDLDTCFGENHMGACVETTTITPGGGFGTPNTGSFEFDLSSNTDGDGNSLPWAEPSWQGRYERIRVKVIASEHWFTWGYSRGWFTIGDGENAETFCNEQSYSIVDRPSEPLSVPLVVHREPAQPHSPAPAMALVTRPQRELSTASLTGTFSLLGNVNFESVNVEIYPATYTLWEDGDTR